MHTSYGEQLNCSAYAGAAVSQQEQNAALSCGFTGRRWSANFKAHYDWCNSGATMAQLTEEDNARKQALLKCAQKPKKAQAACQDYASEAVLQARIANAGHCGLSGGRWTQVYARHFDWCLTANQTQRDGESSARKNQLQGCFAAKKAQRETDCVAYSQTAVMQNEDNLKRKCGFKGSRWSNDAQSHFKWCMGVTSKQTKAEADIRNAALKDSCHPQVKAHCWTESHPKLGIPPWEIKRICRYE